MLERSKTFSKIIVNLVVTKLGSSYLLNEGKIVWLDLLDVDSDFALAVKVIFAAYEENALENRHQNLLGKVYFRVERK